MRNFTGNQPLQRYCDTVLTAKKAALCLFAEPENSPKVMGIWEMNSTLKELRKASVSHRLNLWVKTGTWLASFISWVLDERPLGPRERLRGTRRKSPRAKKADNRKRCIWPEVSSSLILFLLPWMSSLEEPHFKSDSGGVGKVPQPFKFNYNASHPPPSTRTLFLILQNHSSSL